MQIHNGAEALKTLLGVPSATSAEAAHPRADAASSAAFAGDEATLSTFGAQVAQSLSTSDVRLDKVASIQSALAAGNYQVPASAVASRIVEAMLGGGSSH